MPKIYAYESNNAARIGGLIGHAMFLAEGKATRTKQNYRTMIRLLEGLGLDQYACGVALMMLGYHDAPNTPKQEFV